MKTRRWMKSVIATAKSPEMAATALPWQRGALRAAMTAKRRPSLKVARRACRAFPAGTDSQAAPSKGGFFVSGRSVPACEGKTRYSHKSNQIVAALFSLLKQNPVRDAIGLAAPRIVLNF